MSWSNIGTDHRLQRNRPQTKGELRFLCWSELGTDCRFRRNRSPARRANRLCKLPGATPACVGVSSEPIVGSRGTDRPLGEQSISASFQGPPRTLFIILNKARGGSSKGADHLCSRILPSGGGVSVPLKLFLPDHDAPPTDLNRLHSWAYDGPTRCQTKLT